LTVNICDAGRQQLVKKITGKSFETSWRFEPESKRQSTYLKHPAKLIFKMRIKRTIEKYRSESTGIVGHSRSEKTTRRTWVTKNLRDYEIVQTKLHEPKY
jgi:hypothetical protein